MEIAEIVRYMEGTEVAEIETGVAEVEEGVEEVEVGV